MVIDADLWLVAIAWRLDRLRWVPRMALDEIVSGRCTCLWVLADEPPWQDRQLTDRQLAAWLCAGCRVQDECLELELRTTGEQTIGVWGGLCENDRRGVYLHWLERGERAADLDDLSDGSLGGGPRL